MNMFSDIFNRATRKEAPAAPSHETLPVNCNKRPYAATILFMLTITATGYSYSRNQTDFRQVRMPASSVVPTQPVASSGAHLTLLPVTAGGAPDIVCYEKTKIAKRAKHRAKKSHHTFKKPAVLTESNPLQAAYRALIAGHLSLAEQKYMAALARNPHEKDALLGLAVIARRRMQTDRAIKRYRQVLREDMGNAPAAAGLVSLSALTDPLAAESQLRELLDLKPAAAEFHYALGNVLARQLRWGEAQQSFFRACTLAPDNALYLYNLAVSLERIHKGSAALPYYERAARLNNDPALNIQEINKRITALKTVGNL